MGFLARLAKGRGDIKVDAAKCVYCGACQKKCHHRALAVNVAEKTWSVNGDKCLRCAHCVKACPRHALSLEKSK
jgi:formate hydrogenlyase subunit 6/NADH:ubiquinone oxidoreductase subunit I